MLVREFYRTREDGVNLYRTYSNLGMYILQNETSIEYMEAIDVENAPYTYSETDKPIDTDTKDGWYEVEEPKEIIE